MNKFIYISVGVVGAILLVLGAILHWAVIPKIIHNKVIDQMQLRNGTEAFERFSKLPVPLQWKMTFFEISNPEEFDKNKDVMKLKFNEKGPYVYDEHREKYEIEFSKDGFNVSYKEKRDYVFNAKLSGKGLSPDDSLKLVSPVFGIVSQLLSAYTDPRYMDASIKKRIQSIATDVVVKEIAFGTNDYLLSKSFFNDSTAPPLVQVVDTGKKDISQLFHFLKYGDSENGKQKVWNNVGPCNDIKGTDAVQFKPFLTEQDHLYAFEPMICKSFKLVHDPKVMQSTSIKGIDTIRYYATDDNFARIPENQCHCTEKNFDLCPADLLNLNNCGVAKGMMDMLVSSPYFQPFPENLRNTTIHAPLPMTYENYGTYVDVEPLTGVVLNARKRLQLYVQLKRGSIK
uniref:Sensory neuron membrane protein n=1 Tax=Tyrophagus putrescentiae TaxID=59818 RepID=A0A3S6QA56_TYRPU|nr:sensory neuron membrane protein [Tyrophagus putrescentiae]